MQRALGPQCGSSWQQGARGREAGRVRLPAQASPACAHSGRTSAGAQTSGRRFAGWTVEAPVAQGAMLSPLGSMKPLGPGSTALMGADGKASSLRKLVVDGVEDSANVQVKFCLKYRTSYGQSVKIIGSHPKLGNWDINKALDLHWSEGDRWLATIELPAGSVYEYKYVLVDHDGRQALAWQGGSNSVLALGDTDEQGVEVQDNWHNNPGQAAVLANGQTLTRETKLQAWADEMRQYRALARTAQYELTRKAEELQASKAQVARLKMELSMSLKQREELESRLAEVESENLSLRAQVAQSQIAMKSTLEEAIKLLQQEIEEGEEELFSELGEDLAAAVAGSSSTGGSGGSSSSGSGGWGWGRGKEPEAVYSNAGASNGNGNGNGSFERFGWRMADTRSEHSPSAAAGASPSVLADWRTRLGGL